MIDKLQEQNETYQRIEQALQYLGDTFREQPNLDEIAARVNLSKYHFQRLFKRWAGVTPAQFSHYLTVQYAKGQLRAARSVFETTLEAGLSSPGRLHDLFVTFEAMTPGEYKKLGSGLEIGYGFHPTPFGTCLVAKTARGICALRFISHGEQEAALTQLSHEWPRADFSEDAQATGHLIQRLFDGSGAGDSQAFHLLLKGTNFQVQVWQALLSIPPGALVSYQDVAAHLSTPSAARAVANAVAANPVAYLIPCHRVITRLGEIHRYRWGVARKKAILGWEASQAHAHARI